MEIRDSVKQVGKRCEPAESDFHINQATSVNEIKRLEETLLDEETRKLLVRTLSNSLIDLHLEMLKSINLSILINRGGCFLTNGRAFKAVLNVCK